MIVKELVEKLNPKTREIWDIFVDDNEYTFETDLETKNKEVKSWDLEYFSINIYTVDYFEE